MWNDFAYYKKFTFNIIVILIIGITLVNLSFFPKDIAYAETEKSNDEIEQEFSKNIENILDDIDSNELDDYLINDFNLDFLSASSFKELAIKVLNGSYFEEYDSLFDAIVSTIKSNLKDLMKIFLVLLFLVLLYEVFKSFCADKFSDIKNVIKIIFTFVIILLLLQIFKDISSDLSNSIEKIFSFSKILFPILLNLILLSGSSGSYSVYSSLSLFLINTGSYIFTYFLLPLAASIFIMSLFGGVFSNKRLSKILDVFKSVFKYTIIIFFTIFGLFSSVNLITSGAKDGVSLRLTKYAIKNYIPIIGGYISQGFDFIHSCSIVVKNAFGVCGIILLLFIVLKPLILYFVYLLMFKILSAVVALIGNDYFSDMFSNIAKTLSYFIVILVGLFFIVFVFIYLLIISVSVV